MAITAETLLELVNDARDARLALERQIAELEARVEEMHEQRDELEEEEKGYMTTLQRPLPPQYALLLRFPTTPTPCLASRRRRRSTRCRAPRL